MKKLLFLFCLTFIACNSEPNCVEYIGLDWCVEAPTVMIFTDDLVQIENKKDGLFFVADISFQKLPPSKIVQTQENLRVQYSEYTRTHYIKKGIPFECYSTKAPVSKQLSNTEILSGEIYGFADRGVYTIKYRGINQGKVERIINSLME